MFNIRKADPEKGEVLDVVTITGSANPIRQEFYGNTLFDGEYLPDNSIITVLDGAAVVKAPLGRDVIIVTQWSVGELRRAVIDKHFSNGNYRPELNYKKNLGRPFRIEYGSFSRVVNPMDIVVASEPVNTKVDDRHFNLVKGPLCTIHSAGDLVFIKSTPERMTAVSAGAMVLVDKLGAVSVVNSYSLIGVSIGHIGDLCSVSTNGKIQAGSTGFAVAMSAGGGAEIGPSKKNRPPFGTGSVATVNGVVTVFGSEENTQGIVADSVVIKKKSESSRPTRIRGTHRPLELVIKTA